MYWKKGLSRPMPRAIGSAGEEIFTLSVDRRATVREYESRYVVTFELLDAAGKAVVPLQKVELAREYTYDALRPSGSPQEQELLQAELRKEMQTAILRRIGAVLRTN